MACLPESLIGVGAAASVASAMTTFPSLRFGLLVGVGRGIWTDDYDARLGDVVVSRPVREKQNGGVSECHFIDYVPTH